MSYKYLRELLGLVRTPYDFRDKERVALDNKLYMLDRMQSMFRYDGLPDTIPHRNIELLMQVNGFACIAEYGGKLYAFYGGLGGEPNEYYMPTLCTVSNPALGFSKSFEIDKDCIVIPNDAMYLGLMPMFSRYATLMAENELSMTLGLVNSRAAFLLDAPDDGSKEAANKFLRDLWDGKSGAIAANRFLDGIKVNPLAQVAASPTINSLIEMEQYLKASWFNELGLDANYNMKREKLTTTESQMNNDALLPLVDDMLRCRRVGLEKVNAMFGTNISVELASSWEDNAQQIEQELSVQTENERGDSGEELAIE